MPLHNLTAGTLKAIFYLAEELGRTKLTVVLLLEHIPTEQVTATLAAMGLSGTEEAGAGVVSVVHRSKQTRLSAPPSGWSRHR